MQDAAHWLTESEFLAHPETQERVEFIDGEVIVSPSGTLRHQRLIGRLLVGLSDWADSHHAEVAVSPLDIRFAPNRILQPDLAVFLHALPQDVSMPLTVIPELCVEVLSTNRDYDRRTKRLVYGEAGVRELWLVDPEGTVERWSGAKLTVPSRIQRRIETPLLPGFEMPLEALFR